MGDLENFSKLQVNTRSSHSEVFYKKMFLKILQISKKNVFAAVSFLKKLQVETWNGQKQPLEMFC